jgi:acetylornithine/N-succinyldiaminopimelate aminotransferase
MDKTRVLLKEANDHLLFVTNRPPVVMERGRGMYIRDTEGRRYLDFVGGWAVNALGHSPSVLAGALSAQSRRLVNASPAFFNRPMIEFASLLCALSAMDRAWFANSGAEANEAAVKIARKYGKLHRGGAFEIITTDNSFHGRTLAMMSATGKPAWKNLFEPKGGGFVHVPFNDLAAARAAVNDRTVAIMLEPVQGEGGAVPADPEYLRGLRTLCDEKGVLLILDEIQTGLGRTGRLFGFEHANVEPDILTLGKGIGAGYPLAAVLAKERLNLFEPGEHGGTYGGNPLSCAVGLAVTREILRRDLAGNAERVGNYLRKRMDAISPRWKLSGLRGQGLLLAVDLPTEQAKVLVDAAFRNGLLLNAPRPSTIRFIPALIVREKHIDEMVRLLERALAEVYPG